MRIDPYRNAARISGRSAAGRTGGSAFRLEGSQAGTRAEATAPTQAASGIDALLALQGNGDALESRRRTVQRGHDLLDDLEAMRLAVLGAGLDLDRLDRIAERLTRAREHSTADLDGLIDEIELRVRVELAKHGRFPEG